jgi:LysR family transcriptional regulator for metE and metH
MDIRHLKMIDEVARCRSLTKAAEKLYISQSALSHQLKEAERYCETPLFTRHNKQMILTPAGELLLETSRKIISEMDASFRKIKQLNSKDSGEIRISTQCYTGYPWLASYMKEFSQVYPKVHIKIVPEATRQLLPFLLDNKIDVGIFEDLKPNALEYVPLFTDELLIIVSPEHRFAGRKTIDPQLMKEDAYVMYNLPCEESSFYNLVFKESSPPAIYRMELTEAIIGIVKAGLGFAILPNWITYPYIQRGEVCALRIGRGTKRTWHAGVLKNVEHPPYIRAFISRLAKHMKYHGKVDK